MLLLLFGLVDFNNNTHFSFFRAFTLADLSLLLRCFRCMAKKLEVTKLCQSVEFGILLLVKLNGSMPN